MKKNKYKVTRKDIKNSPINYSFTEVAIKNVVNSRGAYNINKLQQENKQLKEQLAIKEKENESLNGRINNIENLFRGRSRATKRTGDVYKDFVLEIRKQVCDEIREKLCRIEDTLINLGNGKEDALNYFVKILDQIEQGENNVD